jgi:hypothetical protein
MPRPLHYDAFVGGACTAQERADLMALAQQDRLTLSEKIRQLIRDAAKRDLPRREGGQHGFDPAA